MNNVEVFNKYCIHVFLRHFSLTLFFTFGALLIYSKTNSAFWVLFFGLISSLAGLFMRSFGIVFLWKFFQRSGIQTFMGIGLFLLALSFFGLFYLNSSSQYFLIIFIILAIIHDFGAGIYFIPANAVLFNCVGSLKLVGKYSSFISITTTVANIIGALVGIFLNVQEFFIYLFPLSGLILLLSIIPLKGIKLPINNKISLKSCLKCISLKALIANFELDVPIRFFALPLIILVFSSTSASIWIVGISAMTAAIFAYFTGKFKDGKNPYLNISALVLSILVWFIYGFISSVSYFILLGIFERILYTIILVGSEARLSREIANTNKPIEATIEIEIARLFGSVVSFIMLIIVYLMTNNLPQTILILGGFFMIPKAFYAIGNVDHFKTKN